MARTEDWITDRRPTGADGDEDGDVMVDYNPDEGVCSYRYWSNVADGVPWQHCDGWQPPTAPEPAPTCQSTYPGDRVTNHAELIKFLESQQKQIELLETHVGNLRYVCDRLRRSSNDARLRVALDSPKEGKPALAAGQQATVKTWARNVLVLLTLLAIYAAGHSQAMQARLQHPACHPNLKP